jgi:hypothetical protein
MFSSVPPVGVGSGPNLFRQSQQLDTGGGNVGVDAQVIERQACCHIG